MSQHKTLLLLILTLQALPISAQVVTDRPASPRLEAPGYLPNADEADANFELPAVPAAAGTAKSGGETVRISSLALSGNTVFSDAELNSFAQPFLNQAMNAADIEMLRQALTRYYIDRGYINSGALFGEPAISGSTLNFKIVEGRLTDLRLQGAERLNQRYLSDRMLGAGDQPFNMQNFRERFQLFLDDPLFDQLNARLVPGVNPGEAILDLEVDRARPYQLSTYAHNARSPSIGSEVMGVSAWIRNLTGRGDFLQASVESADDDESINSQSISWTVPISFRGADLHLSWDKSDSVLIEPPLDVLDIKSELETREVGIGYTFRESLQEKIRFGLDYVEKENRTELLGEPFSFVPNESTGEIETESWRFWQEYSHRTVSRVIALRSTFAFTDTNLQDPVLDPDAFRTQDTDYKYWIGQFHYAQQLRQGTMQLVVRGTVQVSGDNLLSLDGLAIGGNSSVRGYRENQLIRDEGFVVTAELRYPLWDASSRWGELTLVPFVDFGQGKNNNGDSDDLSSVGIALHYKYKRLAIDVAFAEQLEYPDLVDAQSGNLQDDGIHFRISYDLF